MFEKIVSNCNGIKGLLADLPQGKEVPSMEGVFNEEIAEEKGKKKKKDKSSKVVDEPDGSSNKGENDGTENTTVATEVKVTEPPVAQTASSKTGVGTNSSPVSSNDTYEEVLAVLAKTGYFIDNADGELDKVSKDLYGFKHEGRVVVLAPKAAAAGDDYILLQSITLARQVIDGVMKLEPTYGASFGVACGTPLVTEVNEDVVNLHNKLLQSVGYTGQGNLVVRQSPDGSLVTMAGHLVSLTQSQ